MSKIVFVSLMIVLVTVGVFAQDVSVELLMPRTNIYPSASFALDVKITNSGLDLKNAQLFLAFNLGTDEYWFYPDWVKYPSEICWQELLVEGDSETTIPIFPEFLWPDGTGSIDSASFVACLVHQSILVSNVGVQTFSVLEKIPYPDMAYIPPGTYFRGKSDDDPCCDEVKHQVTLTRGFHIMTTEVTRRMWKEYRYVLPHLPPDASRNDRSPTLNHPLQNMTWCEALYFANALSLYYGLTPCYYEDSGFTRILDTYEDWLFYRVFFDYNANGFRLPTDAEWEYAARAGSTGPFYLDEPNYNELTCKKCSPDPPLNVLNTIAWWCGNCDGISHPVGEKLPNQWGLYDVLGNVSEWCFDCWAFYDETPLTDPVKHGGYCYNRVTRGGSTTFPLNCSLPEMYGIPPGRKDWGVGFRLNRNAE